MTDPKMTDQQTPSPKQGNRHGVNPDKSDPAAAEKYVRSILKKSPINLDLAAAELAPLFGFGEDSTYHPIPRGKSQAIFTSHLMTSSMGEFGSRFIRGDWGQAVARWEPTLALVREHIDSEAWQAWWQWRRPDPVPWNAGADMFYARCIIQIFSYLDFCLQRPHGPLALHSVKWLRDVADADLDDACWILFHAVMYRHLRIMKAHKDAATYRERLNHFIRRVTGEKYELLDVLDEIAYRFTKHTDWVVDEGRKQEERRRVAKN